MEKKSRPSVFETYIYGARLALDNMRSFVLSFLAALSTFIGAVFFVLIVGYSALGSRSELLKAVKTRLVEMPNKVVMEGKAASEIIAKNKKIFSEEQINVYKSALKKDLKGKGIVFILLALLFLFLLYLWLWIGFVRMVITLQKTGSTAVSLIFSEISLLPRVFFATVLFLILFSIGLMFFIIPGLYIALRLGLYSFFIVDKNAGAIESLRKSWDLTKGHEWYMVGISILLPAVLKGGLLAFFLTMIISISIGSYAYTTLLKFQEKK